jgi:hypothetical protein
MRRWIRSAFMPAVAVCLLGTAAAVVPAAPASASVSNCDRGSYVGIYDTVGSGASITAAGRTLHLQNHTGDLYSFAHISWGYRSGDAVWIDRSIYWITPQESATAYPSTAAVQQYGGGWKQCGPFFETSSDLVRATTVISGVKQGYATRACFRPAGGGTSYCGKWYVDRH